MKPRPLWIRVAVPIALALVASACRFPDLNTALATAPMLAETSIIYAADGSILTELHAEQDRDVIPLEKIPMHVRNAVIAIEDRRFYEHGGVDLRAIFRAAYENAQSGEIVQGGSTITEQYIKNILDQRQQTFVRKFNEAALAWQMEQQYTKDQILGRYLNTVYFGQGAYGIKAAARAYFSKEPARLSLPQSAMLAGLIQAPSTYDPINRPKKIAKGRRNVVLQQMYEQGMITAAEYRHAKRSGLALHPDRTEREDYEAPYFIDYLKRWFLSNPKFGATYDERYDLLFSGGLRIHTTLDPNMQRAAEDAVDRTLTQSSDPYGALTAIDPRNGHIVAMVGGRDYFGRHSRFSKINLATGGSTGRQAGSSFKPFILVAALESGMKPSKTYPAPSCLDIKQEGGKKPWHVCNADIGSYGSLSIASATTHSVNTVFAQMIMDVGPEQAVRVAKRMGIRCCVGSDPEEYPVTQPTSPLLGVPSAVLGSNEVNTLEMASALGTLATGGSHIQPTPVTEIKDSDGRPLFEAHPDPRQVVDPAVAEQANQILSTVVSSGTGTAANIGRPQIGKTGTAQNYSDAWFIGAVPQVSAAVWVGYPQGQKSMCCTRIGTVYGGTWPAQIWRAFMARATAGMAKESFPKGGVRYVKVTVDVSRGCLPNRFTPPGLIEKQTYISGQEPTRKCTEPKGYESYPVPSVIGLSEQRAEQELSKLGFGVKVISGRSEAQKDGFVMAQSPAAGVELQTNKTVVITVVKEPKKDQ